MKQFTKWISALCLLMAMAGADSVVSAMQGDGETVFTIRHRGQAWELSQKDMMALATTELRNHRENRAKPAIPLEKLLAVTGLSFDQIGRVILLRGEGSPVIIRPSDMRYVEHLVLSTGPMLERKGAWELSPEDETTYEALSEIMGSRRKHDVTRMDVTLREDLPK